MSPRIRSLGALAIASTLVIVSGSNAHGGPVSPTTFARLDKLNDTRIVVESASQKFGYDMLMSHGYLFQAKNGCVMFQRRLDSSDPNEATIIPESQIKPQFLIFPKGSRVVLRGTAVQVNRKIIKLGEDVYPKLGISFFDDVTSESLLPWFANIPLGCRPWIGDRIVEIAGI